MTEKQRLEEAVWRIQGLAGRSQMSKGRARILDDEIKLLADALGVRTLSEWHKCPVCGHIRHDSDSKDG